MSEQVNELESFLATAREEPESVDVDATLELLEADESTVRLGGLRALTSIAQDDVDRVVDHADRIVEALDDGFPPAESAAARLLSVIGQEHPEAIRPGLEELIHMLDQEPPMTGYRSARALAPLLEHDPDGFVPHADSLLDVLVDPPEVYAPGPEELEELPEEERQRVTDLLESRRDQIAKDTARAHGIREIAANALVEVAERDPEVVVDRIEELPPVLSEEPPIVRSATIDVIATVARDDPAPVAPTIDALIEAVETDIEPVQAHAVRALGFAEATEAVEPLRELAEADVDAELRGLAADTADYLEHDA